MFTGNLFICVHSQHVKYEAESLKITSTIVSLISFHPTFFCCWLSNARSKRSTLEMSRLSLQNELRLSVRSSRSDWTNAQPNFRVLITRCRMFSVRRGQIHTAHVDPQVWHHSNTGGRIQWFWVMKSFMCVYLFPPLPPPPPLCSPPVHWSPLDQCLHRGFNVE